MRIYDMLRLIESSRVTDIMTHEPNAYCRLSLVLIVG